MGGSARRQRSTSATRRRAERRRQSSTTDGIEEEATTIHGLSTNKRRHSLPVQARRSQNLWLSPSSPWAHAPGVPSTSCASADSATSPRLVIYSIGALSRICQHFSASLFIWILATSSLVLVITPPSSNHIRSTSHDPITVVEKFIRESTSSFKMNAEYNIPMDEMNQERMNKEIFMPNRRPQGLRWRDDARMQQIFASQHQYGYDVRPILTEQPQHAFGMGASTSNHHATTSDYNEPDLMDMDLIDILWRSDIAVEKGTQQVAPAEQYESDLQTLTEKSTVQVLTAEEQARYEDYSRSFYQDFYMGSNQQFYQKPSQQHIKMSTPEQQTPPNELDESLPTDEDLDELLKDVSSEQSELNKVFGSKSPVENDASLSEALVYTPANMTEMQEIQDSCNQVNITAASVVSSSQSATLFNDTNTESLEQWQGSEVVPNDVFPQSNYVYIGMHNDSAQPVVSNGQISYDHAYSGSAQSPLSPLNIGSSHNGRQQQTQTSPVGATGTATITNYDRIDSYILRNSLCDTATDSSSPCSRLSSESPRYNSETSSSVYESRFRGKLLPSRDSRFERNSRSPTKIGRVNPMSNGQRKRGRQSKDEQLASEHLLPVSAHQISEMSLSELQQVLKNEGLSEYQKQLIRKIRRRGKNKVAARTCRQRRTDRHDKVMSLYQ